MPYEYLTMNSLYVQYAYDIYSSLTLDVHDLARNLEYIYLSVFKTPIY